MQKFILDLMVCPSCKGKLLFLTDKNELICKFHKLAFPIENNIPIMILDKAQKLNN